MMKNNKTNTLQIRFFCKILFVIFLVFPNIKAQKTNINFERISVEQGLPIKYMSSIHQDKFGFIWINTLDGAVLYDGYQYRVFANDLIDSNSLPNSAGVNNYHSLYEADDGTVWICTGNGMSRFNRTTEDFTNYFPKPANYYDPQNKILQVIKNNDMMWVDVPNNLFTFDLDSLVFKSFGQNRNNPSKGIYYKDPKIIFVDKTGSFWVISGEYSKYALSRYDNEKEIFIHFLPDNNDEFSFCNSTVNSIISDKDDTIWLATNGSGLCKISDKVEGKFEYFQHTKGNPNSIISDTLLVVYEDTKGNIWTGGLNGFSKINRLNDTLSTYQLATDHSPTNSIQIIDIDEDLNGNLWFGSNWGVYFFDQITKKIFHYQNDPNDDSSLSGNSIQQIFIDNTNQIWILTKNNGISKFNPFADQFHKIVHNNQKNNLTSNHITGFLIDSQDYLWIGTSEGGLNKTAMNMEHNFENFQHYQLGSSSEENTITALFEDKEKNIWIGGLGGLYHFDPKSDDFTRYQHDPENFTSISNSSVESIFEDSEGIFWIGTQNGLNIMDRASGEFLRLKNRPDDPTSLNGTKISAIYEDHKNNLWIAGDGYLNKFVRSDTSFIIYKQDRKDTGDIVTDDILCITEDNSNNLWFGGYYLTSMNIDDKSFRIHSKSDGLPSNIIKGIIFDNNDLWLSTGHGLSKFSIKNKKFQNFDLFDGTAGLEFIEKSFYKDQDGWLYFGGLNGFNVFHPYSFKKQFINPPVYITGFHLFDERKYFDRAVYELDEIILNYNENNFTFDFIALDFQNSADIQYAYKLAGFDDDWQYCDTERQAKYTNIKFGDYIFHVNVSNDEGILNENGAKIKLTIKPPLWQSGWAYLFYVIILIVAFMENRKYRSKKELIESEKKNRIIAERTKDLSSANSQLQNEITEHKKAEIALAKAKGLAELASKSKSDFLARMSHEIRTPMNAIIGMSHLALQTDLNDKQRDYLIKVQSSSNALLGIINDILDFSKIEAGKLDMESIEFDLEEVLDNLTNLISIKAEEKGLEFLFEIERDVPRFLIGDPLRIGQVLTNLTNNAVKFTEKGEIVVSVKKIAMDDKNATLQFSVRDTGIGLTQKQIGKLFKSFSQADGSITHKYGGTGLGLAICKRLVELMKGDISVESEPGEGSTFKFTAMFEILAQMQKTPHLPEVDIHKKRALIVDDNSTSRIILKNALESFTFITTAVKSGESAIEELEKAESENNPYTLVLMDWKMPGMNGIETINRIRSNSLLTKIPKIILVTAYGRKDIHLKAQNCGIDNFLIKPVNNSVLFDTIMEILGHDIQKTPSRKIKDVDPEKMKNILGARVLLVEDNEINQQIAMELLQKTGVIVSVANNGIECVTAVSESNYDLVLMDIQMPEMDGLEATKKIRSSGKSGTKELPIVAMTAHAMVGDKEKSLEAGMNEHITKPLDSEQLIRTLIEWIKPGQRVISKKIEQNNQKPIPTVKDPKALELNGIDVKSGLRRVGGSMIFYKKLLVKFHTDYSETPEQIKAAIDDHDFELATRMAHTIKGIAGNLGASDLQQSADELEKNLKSGTIDNIDDLLKDFKQDLSIVFDSLNNLPEIRQKNEIQKSDAQVSDSDKLLELLIELEPFIKSRKPKPCKRIIAEIQKFTWADDLSSNVADLGKMVGKYKFKDAQLILESLLINLKKDKNNA